MARTAQPLKVLVVDDDDTVRDVASRLIKGMGHEVTRASSAAEALKLIGDLMPDAVVSDVKMPGMDGLELLAEIKTRRPEIEVIMMTAYADVESAVRAMKAGALDYIMKPVDVVQLENALAAAAMKRRPGRAPGPGGRREGLAIGDGSVFVGRSDEMLRVFETIESVRTNRATVLIWGETGTGKERAARAIHFGGPRAASPFVPVNCGAIPKDLLESQLFGHVRGAFTGAIADHQGFFRAAGDGTIFLDEVTEIGLGLQAKLLRVLQERSCVPVGDTKPMPVAARVIAATNRNPEDGLADGELREDLYYRLSVVRVEIPPLRRRKSDIPVLAEHFLEKHASLYGMPRKQLTAEAKVVLMEHEWPGNVRELENVIERLYALGASEQVSAADVAGGFRNGSGDARTPSGSPQTLRESERGLIVEALKAAGGNKKKAAEILGIPRQRLYRRLKAFGIDGADKDGDE